MRGRAAIAALLASLTLVACDNRQNAANPAGGRGSKGAPADPALVRLAQEALPFTRGLERCRAAYGSYPPNPEATMGCLPRIGAMARQGHFVRAGEWMISPDATGAGYTMSRQIDAHAMLLRKCERQTCRWIYDPGNGQPSLEVNLGA